ncbi:DUF418 domain-containing protein [Lunatimonas lonarensis]|nr:DUF418 domain-containing protein [Lunatimonas lonarensis]
MEKGKSLERLIELDAARGLALAGILAINLYIFNAPYAYLDEYYGQFGARELILLEVVYAVFGGKAMFLFAFLFGYGFYLQAEKHQKSVQVFRRLYLRRMLVLAGFGITHILFFWYGDILLAYALMGCLLLLFYRMPSWFLSGLAVLLFLSPAIYVATMDYWPTVPLGTALNYSLSEVISIYQNGGYPEFFKVNLHQYLSMKNETVWVYMPKALAAFIVGFLFAKRNGLGLIRIRPGHYIGLAVLFLAASVLMHMYKEIVFDLLQLTGRELLPVRIGMQIMAFDVMQSLGYILLIFSLMQYSMLSKPFILVGFAGRMALTNYLMQTVAGLLIFSFLGLGLFGSMAPTQLLVLTGLIFFIQVGISRFYLGFFKQGPMEDLWRRFL